MIILLETNVNERSVERISSAMGFAENFRVPVVEQARGIWILWNITQVKIEILANSNQVVHFYIEDNSNPTWVCSAIYANTNPRMREIL